MSALSNFNKKATLVAVLSVLAVGAQAQSAQPASALSLPALKAESGSQNFKPTTASEIELPKAPDALVKGIESVPKPTPAPKSAISVSDAEPSDCANPTSPKPCAPKASTLKKTAPEQKPVAVDPVEPKKNQVKVEKRIVVVKKVVEVKKEDAVEQKFAAAPADELVVSDRDFNHFIFDSPITQLLFPSWAPVVGTPLYVAENKQALVQFKRGLDKPFQMIVETESGEVYKLYLKARPVNGTTHKIGAKPKAVANPTGREAPRADNMSAGGADIQLLRRVIAGDTPADFEPVDLPGITRFDKFTAIPLTGYANGKKRVSIFTLAAVPGQSAIIAPPMFYRTGVTAVLIDGGDTVNAETSPQLYIVEDLNDE